MALDRLTKVDGGGISTTSDYRVGVITATKFVGPIDGVVTGSLTGTATTAVNAQGLIGTPNITVGILTASSANFSGNVTIGGTLTYEDVTNIDSVGIITARDGIDCNADLDVDGHTNLDNVSVAGVSTFSDDVTLTGASGNIVFDKSDNSLNIRDGAALKFGDGNDLIISHGAAAHGHVTFIDEAGAGRLRIRTNDFVEIGKLASAEKSARFFVDGAVELYHDDVKRLETSAKGIQVGTGVTIETNGQATFVGVVTFGSGSTTIDNNVVNVGTALTLGHTQGVQFHTQNLHSRGFEVNQINASGIITASSFRGPTGGTATFQDIDVDGHTNLDNVSVAGVTTMTGALKISSTTDQMLELNSSDNNGTSLAFQRNGSRQGYIGYGGGSSGLIIANEVDNGAVAIQGKDGGSAINMLSFDAANKGLATLHGGATIPLDLDVDGHTNLDNVSVAGVSTFSGNVTISPSGDPILTVTGSGHPQLTLTNTSGADHCGVNFGDSSDHNAGMIQYTNNGDYMVFHTAGVERLRIDGNGVARFFNSTGDFKVASTTGNDGGKIILQENNLNAWSLEAQRANGDFYIKDEYNNRERFRIEEDGTVGINAGNAASSAVFKICKDGSGEAQLRFETASSNTASIVLGTDEELTVKYGGTERLRITPGGAIAISGNRNQVAPTAYDDLTGTDQAGLIIGSSGITDAGIMLRTGTSGTGRIYFGDNSGSDANRKQGQINYYNNGDYMQFVTAGSERVRITSGGVVKIGGDVSNASADVGTVTKLTIKQHTNTHEGGMYIERSGERRGWYMYVGGAGGYNDALCITTNQLGTDTNVLAIDRGNRLAKLGGDVIIDSTNNGYGGLRIYDDTSGGYNVNYVGGRSDGNFCHKFWSGGRSQNQSPWTDTTGNEIMRVSLSNGIQLHGDTNSGLQYHSGDHYKFRTNGRERVHIDNRGVMTAPKLSTKALIFSPVTSKWGSQRTVANFVMQFYTGSSGATYHFMRMISQTDWGFDDVEIRQYRYQYNPSGSDHTVRRYYTYYGGHGEQIVRYNQNGSGTGTSNDNYINKRTDFGPGGALQIHQASNGGYYRDCYGSDYAISLGAYYGVVLEIKITATVGTYDTGDYATAYDFYPANYGAQATQSNADNWQGPRGVWFNTTSNGTGTGTAPCISNKNSERGWHTGTSFLDTSA